MLDRGSGGLDGQVEPPRADGSGVYSEIVSGRAASRQLDELLGCPRRRRTRRSAPRPPRAVGLKLIRLVGLLSDKGVHIRSGHGSSTPRPQEDGSFSTYCSLAEFEASLIRSEP